jgi:iron complex outermembrane recepter protein
VIRVHHCVTIMSRRWCISLNKPKPQLTGEIMNITLLPNESRLLKPFAYRRDKLRPCNAEACQRTRVIYHAHPPLNWLTAVLGLAAAAFLPATTLAQSTATVGASALEEVVVTARRREENSQHVPIAITVLSGEDLYKNSVTDMEKLRFQAPSLQVSPTPFGASVPGYTLRGQRQLESLATQDPSIVVYFADMPFMRPHGTNGAFYDLASVQVLKGPQGTLFGRNTTGGAVLVTPHRPTHNAGGELTAEFGNYNLYGLTAVFNAPLTDTLAMRVAGRFRKHDGYTTNLFNGRKLDDEDTNNLRLSLLWQPSEALDIYTVYQKYKMNNAGQGWRNLNINTAAAVQGTTLATLQSDTNTVRSADWHTVINDQNSRENVDTWSISNTSSLQLEAITLKNIVGYRSIKTDISFDYDASSARIIGAGTGNISLFNSQNNLDGDQFSEEFQVLGTALDKRLDWISGLFYFREKNFDDQRSDLFGRRANTGTGTNKSHSVFAQGTYRFAGIEGLSITAGYRYTWDKRQLDAENRIQSLAQTALNCRLTVAGVPLNPCLRTTKYDGGAGTYLLSAEYQLTEQTLTYLAHRHGYRSGGLQLRANAATEPTMFDPEYVDDIELGLKSTFSLGGMRMRTNVAVFDQKYKDIQRTLSFNPAPGQPLATLVINAAKATIQGGEFEVTLLPTDRLELTAFFGYTDAHYDSFTNPGISNAALAIPGRPLKDNEFAMVPKISASASARYQLPLASAIGEVSIQGNWYTQSKMQLSDINSPNGQVASYDLINLAADWQAVYGKPFDLRLFVQNATDKDYALGGISVWTTGFESVTLGAPRTFGFSVRYRFGE